MENVPIKRFRRAHRCRHINHLPRCRTPLKRFEIRPRKNTSAASKFGNTVFGLPKGAAKNWYGSSVVTYRDSENSGKSSSFVTKVLSPVSPTHPVVEDGEVNTKYDCQENWWAKIAKRYCGSISLSFAEYFRKIYLEIFTMLLKFSKIFSTSFDKFLWGFSTNFIVQGIVLKSKCPYFISRNL